MPDRSRETLQGASHVGSYGAEPAVELAGELATFGEAFVSAWSSVPDDLPERVSTSQLRALIAIRRGDGATVTDLARALDALPSSATRLCDRLIAAGYIERMANPANRRFHVLSLSPLGEQLLVTLEAHRRRALATVLDRMSPRARQQLGNGLSAFALGARQAGASPVRTPLQRSTSPARSSGSTGAESA
jgi:DNA-binding MarR family transcriptional regulator